MLKQLTANLLIGLLIITAAAGQQSQMLTQTIRVRKNTALKFATMRTLDSTTAKVGEEVLLRLVRPLVVDGVTLLPAGEMVHSRISKVKRASPHCDDGDIQLKLEPLSFPDSSSASIKVWYTSPSPNIDVPEQYVCAAEVCNVGDAILESLFVGPLVILTAPLLIVSQCKMPGKEYQLPENATVAVLITRDHKVRH